MDIFLTTLHVLACLVLILVVLLQHGKGADMGAVLGGGGGNTVFGSRGAGNFLSKLTTVCAVLFMLTSLSLSYMKTQSADTDLFDPGSELAEEPLLDAQPEGEVEAGLEEIGELEEIEVSADELEEIEIPAESGE
jgi:preprotein translocase subunit SecG